jgi:phenylpropionate dioxygenase-like ring-hydroxylating dioxygenase large terminal subunit
VSELILFGRDLPDLPPPSALPDWQQADPRWMDAALQTALGRSGGGWFVVDERRRFGSEPRRYRIDDREFVFWMGERGLMAAPDACPHMGASLAAGCVRRGRLVCPWHGLELGEKPQGAWRPVPIHDDGVLVWLRLDDAGEAPTELPMLPVRPARYIDAVVRLEARCRPEDLLANRLDPWHGVHYHPHTFRRLRVVERGDDQITVRVAFAVLGRLAVEVDARFHCPDPRTIVMTIVRGDGVGSVVETHATPIDEHRCAVIEATLATSDRPQMKYVLPLARWVRPWLERRAARLWIEDVAYAERRRAVLDRQLGVRDDA